MTKYELVRIIGTRIKQLTRDAKPMIKNIKGLSYYDIAILEKLKNNLVPINKKIYA